MLGEGHADRRQLSDLVATEPPTRGALLSSELPAATTARVRIVIDDFIDLVLRPLFAADALMPALTASLTLHTIPTHQLLGLRPRRRTPLCARPRWIRRRRPGTRPRILTQLRL